MAFNVATANRYDHLRNHGFLCSPAGWRLAPAYDMNPSFKKDEHVLSLDLYSREPSLDLVLSIAEYYRLATDAASSIIDGVREVVDGRQGHARKLGLSARDCSEAEHLFDTGT